MQGVAQAVGMDQLVAIKRSAHPAYDPDSVKHFANAYDGFWKILGGVELPGPGYLIALPFYLKPLSEMPAQAPQARRHPARILGRDRRSGARARSNASSSARRCVHRARLPRAKPRSLAAPAADAARHWHATRACS